MDPRFLEYDWNLRVVEVRDGKNTRQQFSVWRAGRPTPEDVPKGMRGEIETATTAGRSLITIGLFILAIGIVSLFLPLPEWIRLILWLAAFLLTGYGVILRRSADAHPGIEREAQQRWAALEAQTKELVRYAEDARRRMDLEKSSPAEEGRRQTQWHLEHADQTERTYTHENNPIGTPAKRRTLAAYIQQYLRGELDIAARPTGEIEELFKFYWEADHLSLLSARTQANKPAPPPKPEPKTLEQELEEGLQHFESIEASKAKVEAAAEKAAEDVRDRGGSVAEQERARRATRNRGMDLLNEILRSRAQR